MRASLIFIAVAVAAVGCGEDTVTGSGGTGGGSTTGATTGGSPTTTTAGSGEGGDTGSTTTSSTGGSTGEGGSNEGGSSGIPEWVPGETVTEGCEHLNAHYDAIGDELGCEVATPGNCAEPDECPDEILGFINCLGATTTPDHCACVGGEGGGSAAELICDNDPECTEQNDALVSCLDG